MSFKILITTYVSGADGNSVAVHALVTQFEKRAFADKAIEIINRSYVFQLHDRVSGQVAQALYEPERKDSEP